MYVYIFEDGTVQQSNEAPTDNDRMAIADGLLIVLYSETSIVNVDEYKDREALRACRVVKKGGECWHQQV